MSNVTMRVDGKQRDFDGSATRCRRRQPWLRRGLAASGHVVDTETDGVAGASLAREDGYDAVVLDLRLPRKDGLGVLREVAAFERQRQFSADAAHELRAPLTAIRLEAEVALQVPAPESAAAHREALTAIVAESRRMDELLEVLLLAAAADAGVPAQRGRVELAPMVAEIAQRLQPLADARGVTIMQRVTIPEGATIAGDPVALDRAVAALLDNAITCARSAVEITLAWADDRLRVAVCDDGPGFSDAALQHAVARFWREDRAGRRDGTGLGLALAKAVAEGVGGTIALGNAPPESGGGAVVSLTFPQASPHVGGAAAPESR